MTAIRFLRATSYLLAGAWLFASGVLLQIGFVFLRALTHMMRFGDEAAKGLTGSQMPSLFPVPTGRHIPLAGRRLMAAGISCLHRSIDVLQGRI